jgi:hypothetical protein
MQEGLRAGFEAFEKWWGNSFSTIIMSTDNLERPPDFLSAMLNLTLRNYYLWR